jgi:hypothetical protein
MFMLPGSCNNTYYNTHCSSVCVCVNGRSVTVVILFMLSLGIYIQHVVVNLSQMAVVCVLIAVYQLYYVYATTTALACMQGGCYAVCPRHLGAVPRELIRPEPQQDEDGIADAELVQQGEDTASTGSKLHPLEPERKEGRIIDGGTPSAAFQTELGCFFESEPAVSANG